jgi:hypothetical protein
LAAFAGILILAAFSSAQDRLDNGAAFPSRPAGVPNNFVVTPFGYFHPSCVRSIAEGETLLPDGRVQHANGAVDANALVCTYPHYTSSGARISADVRELSPAIAPVISGWLEYISVTTSTLYTKISATWPVPAAPTNYHGQTDFFFPGFEDTNNILSIVQPVLQFGPSAAGGGKYWAMSSWNCCMSGTVWHSGLVKTKTGDLILGTITPTCTNGSGNCATWKIVTEDTTTAKKTTLNKTPADGQVWNWAFGVVLEVYGVSQCGDLPPDNSLVFTVQLYDENRNLIPDPAWIGTPAGSGVSPQCNYGLNVTPTQETLLY